MILANRIRNVLPDLISENQSADGEDEGEIVVRQFSPGFSVP